MKVKPAIALTAVRASRRHRLHLVQQTAAQRAARQQLVLDTLDVVERNATRVISRLPPQFERQELVAIGYLKLVEKAHRFDTSKIVGKPRRSSATCFAGYTEKAVNGAMWDSARRRNLIEVSHPDLRAADAERVPGDDAEKQLETTRRAALATEALRCLNPRELKVVTEFYTERGNLGEIGKMLGISPSRASSIHREAIYKMQAYFRLRGRTAA